MAATVRVYKGEELARYGFGDPHPFGPDRHDVFHDELARSVANGSVDYVAPRSATVDELLMFHTPEFVDKVATLSAEGAGFLDEGDTPAVPGIYEAALTVVGSTLDAVDAVMAEPGSRAFVPIAGLHHAGRGHAAGFCVFNDCGVAAEHLRQKHGLGRIAYVDIDAHHGDGMFYAFEDDPALLFADIHEDGRYLYPGTGAAEETGRGAAEGTKLNLPLPPGADDAEFASAWRRVEDYLDAARPEFILFQCGADSLAGDPITHLRYSEQAHADAAAALCRLADAHCEGRLVGTGGGGYNRRNLARAWTRVVQSFVASCD